jgi:hypothetical protein
VKKRRARALFSSVVISISPYVSPDKHAHSKTPWGVVWMYPVGCA